MYNMKFMKPCLVKRLLGGAFRHVPCSSNGRFEILTICRWFDELAMLCYYHILLPFVNSLECACFEFVDM